MSSIRLSFAWVAALQSLGLALLLWALAAGQLSLLLALLSAWPWVEATDCVGYQVGGFDFSCGIIECYWGPRRSISMPNSEIESSSVSWPTTTTAHTRRPPVTR